MKNSHLAIGIAGSIVAGAVLGILFAPDKGSNTRKKITQKSNGLKNSIKDSIDGLASSVEEKYDKITSKLGSADSDKMANAIENGKSKSIELKNEMK